MTIQQALDEIRKSPKWYYIDGICDSRLIGAARRIEVGLAGADAKRRFFEKFGYDFIVDEKVSKRS